MLIRSRIHHISPFFWMRSDTHFLSMFPTVLDAEFNSKGYLIDAGVYYFALALTMHN